MTKEQARARREAALAEGNCPRCCVGTPARGYKQCRACHQSANAWRLARIARHECTNCGVKHDRDTQSCLECTRRRTDAKRAAVEARRGTPLVRPPCVRCGELGHRKKTCPLVVTEQAQAAAQ